MRIAGLTPGSYAALWGDGRTDAGCRFYNYGSEQHDKTAAWLELFLTDINEQIGEVQAKPEVYGEKDVAELEQLRAVVTRQHEQAVEQERMKFDMDNVPERHEG